MFKFLHAADLHLDSPLRGLDKFDGCPADEIRGASRRAVENLVRLAIEENVQFVVIAGDVYDGEWKDHNTGLWFVRKMAELREAGIKVVTIKGNHDAESKIPSGLHLPDNVTQLSTEKADTKHFDDWNVSIHGQGFKTAKVVENLALGYPEAVRGNFNIGLLHTCAGGSDGHHERYSPCSIDTMRSKRYEYDYWALGHVHTRETLHPAHPFIAFPGNTQGRHIRETGPKGCLLVSVNSDSKPKVEFRALDVLRWESCRVDATDATDGDEIIERFRESLVALMPKAEDRPLAVRVEIAGPCPVHQVFAGQPGHWDGEVRRVAADLGAGSVWVEKVRIRTTPPRNHELDVHTLGSMGELVQVLDELRADPDGLRSFVLAELSDLRRRLDRDIRGADELLGLSDDESLLSLLDEVRPLIFEKVSPSAAARS